MFLSIFVLQMLYFVVVLLLTFDPLTCVHSQSKFHHRPSSASDLYIEELYHTMYYLTHQENFSTYFNKAYLSILATFQYKIYRKTWV